jgi:hypothetical protein
MESGHNMRWKRLHMAKHTMIAILDQFSLQERCIKDLPTRFICQQRGQQQQLFFMKLFLSAQ